MIIRKLLIGITFFCYPYFGLIAQGYNHNWLLGSWIYLTDPKGRAFIDSNNFSFSTEYRKMSFLGTQGNISDANGNFLMSSNGIWIANANNDTMLNGSGLNPGSYASSWPYGMPALSNNVFIPFPNSPTKFVLLHHTQQEVGLLYLNYNLFYSIIDITKDSGLGEVISKNNIAVNDTFCEGIGVCKHANGIDWWIAMIKENSSEVMLCEFTQQLIQNLSFQNLNYSPKPLQNGAQLTFSSDGSKFITTTYDNPTDRNSYVILSDFDRCNGVFSNTQTIPVTNGAYIWGLAFSPSGEYIYACSSGYVFQINSTTLAVDTVAVYDGFISPPGSNCCYTTFWNMYLAANGKIYITSGSSVQHIHVINFPDSAGIACDVQQHAIDLVDYLHLRAVPNHPNYYLGCDTTGGCPCYLSVTEQSKNDKLNIFPNPNQGNFLIGYNAQPQSSLLQVYDVYGKIIYTENLPPWSTEQNIILKNISNGMYNCLVTNGDKRVSKKIMVIR